jgi:hypothetical protein
VGGAKRRKVSDPTYGRPKRGLVVSSPVEIDGDSIFVKSSNLDTQDLRFSLLFWDKLAWPSSRAIHFASNPDEVFLERAGVLIRPEYTISGDGAQGIALGQARAFVDLDRQEPGVWSLSRGENSLLVKERIIEDGNGAFVELHRAIPVPDKDVPLNEILEFRRKRYDELQCLREELDTFVAAIDRSDDKAGESEKHGRSVDAACANAIKVGSEWSFPVRLSNLKASIDLRPFNSIADAVVVWSSGLTYGLPLTSAFLLAQLYIPVDERVGQQECRPPDGPRPTEISG